ncbi:phenylalanine--tRNA ligase subunit alpha [Candidatus Kaiserbacteria bacterium RIFCSPHIGHO2_02_FULL_49_11]|uniref:phenylalanine--tRNA ligase n=1 Tax=Candidatus Kaiserbacteria bacterium RIFCSPHIGHO2_02_FULL_49_11 TaxID=1798489 RepID=A0A1F6D135_9BACT|nr:MAG: phenylalanine--tRNA ligase subunit alpha [Candidatus Kaiserbacteria bacterium RIFCSPHIGHO2_02_FULL_49_11]
MENTHIHPISGMIREINSIFFEMGFTFAEGPEIESEYYNFDALNIPKDHPARDMWDTFWLKPLNARKLLRTHTSPVQVRYMEEHEPPLRIIAPGKVYRNEATDMTHEAQFYQLEGLMIGHDVTLAHLKGVLAEFFGKFFGGDVEIRLRPGFFPFVEPGVEVDMRLVGENAPERLKDKWIEIMGAGMVHPKVLEYSGINPKEWQGFAFGAGIERLGMLKYGIDDARLFHTGDLRFVNQF